MPTTTEQSLQRVCFLMRLRPELVADYLRAHQVVWPEMLDALSRHGWQNYSLFLREQDGLVVGYFETPDLVAAQAGMASEEVNSRWQRQMRRFFVGGEDAAPDESMHQLVQYFHLP